MKPLEEPPTLVKRSLIHLPVGFAVGWTRRSETIRLTGRILGATLTEQQNLSNRGPGLSRELTPFEIVGVREAGYLDKARRPVFDTALPGVESGSGCILTPETPHTLPFTFPYLYILMDNRTRGHPGGGRSPEVGPLLSRGRASAQNSSSTLEEHLYTGIPILQIGNQGAAYVMQAHPELGGLVRLIIKPRGPLGIRGGLLANLHVRFLLDEASKGPILAWEGPPKSGKRRRRFARLGDPAAGGPQNR